MPTIEDQIIVLEDRLLAAMKASDITELEELLHEDLVFITPNGHTITKAIDIETYRVGIMKLEDIKISERLIKIMGSEVSVAVTMHLIGNYAEENISGSYLYKRVWKFADRSWQIISGSGYKI